MIVQIKYMKDRLSILPAILISNLRIILDMQSRILSLRNANRL